MFAKKALAVASLLTFAGAVNAEIPIMGTVESKCVVTPDTSGVYGNPTPSTLTTDQVGGGVMPIVRYDVIQSDYYKALITIPDGFTESPTLSDTVVFSGDVSVSEVTDPLMADYDANKRLYNNVTEVDLTYQGSTWFKVSSIAFYGYDKAFPAGQYRSVVTAECIAI